jgi:prophage regulatory protein
VGCCIRFSQLKKMVGLSRSTIWRLERQGLFPKRRKISAQAVGWLEHEVLSWLESREAL